MRIIFFSSRLKRYIKLNYVLFGVKGLLSNVCQVKFIKETVIDECNELSE